MKKIYFRLLLAPAILTLFFAGTNFTGGTPGGKTGSPGDGGSTCTDCHAGTATPVSDWITSDIPELGYVVGETYTITAMASENGVSKFGFELTAEDASGNKVGEFSLNDAGTQLANGDASVTHTSSGTSGSDSKTWTMEWTAPDSDLGVITFYGAFNATNGNSATSGDNVYTSMMSVDESSVGFGNELSIAEFTYGPNPSVGNVQINHAYNHAQINIIDISGKIVFSHDAYLSGTTVDLSDLNAGIYFIELRSGSALKTQKLVLK